MAEAGVPGVDQTSWLCVFGAARPAGRDPRADRARGRRHRAAIRPIRRNSAPPASSRLASMSQRPSGCTATRLRAGPRSSRRAGFRRRADSRLGGGGHAIRRRNRAAEFALDHAVRSADAGPVNTTDCAAAFGVGGSFCKALRTVSRDSPISEAAISAWASVRRTGPGRRRSPRPASAPRHGRAAGHIWCSRLYCCLGSQIRLRPDAVQTHMVQRSKNVHQRHRSLFRA